VVRVWVPGDDETTGPQASLHGLVEHVVSKRGRTFRGEADLVAFIRACLPGAPPEPDFWTAAPTPAPQPETDARSAPSVRGTPGSEPGRLSLSPLPPAPELDQDPRAQPPP